jgi:hypothetical protein
LVEYGEKAVPLIESPRLWEDGQKVRTTFGIGTVMGFDPVFDLYDVELDWRPLDEQVKDVEQDAAKKDDSRTSKVAERNPTTLQTVEEEDESNYLSPATSFDASKQSSKQSLTGMDLSSGRLPLTVEEEQHTSSLQLPSNESEDDLAFGAGDFDRGKAAASPEPTLGETTTSDETSFPKFKIAGSSPSSATTVPHSVTTKEGAEEPKIVTKPCGKHRSKISGKHVSKYSPPTLPKMMSEEDKNRSKFSFWSADSLKGTVDGFEAVKSKSKSFMSPGEKVATPYGMGVVVDHRQKVNVVVVDMVGPWKARAYLQESVVKREGSGFFGSILRQFSSVGDRGHASPRKPMGQLAVGTTIHSAFGEGTVIRTAPREKSPSAKLPSSPTKSHAFSDEKPKSTDTRAVNTIAISLKSWKLRDGKSPTLYCTADAAQGWKSKSFPDTPGHNRESSLFSAIGSLVSGTVESLKKIRVPREIEAPAIRYETRKFERYYKDGAAVKTTYGDGMVQSFRESDGFYTVALLTMSGEIFATAHLQEDSMSYRLAKGCVEGYPVLTSFGSGVLHSVNPTTGVHNVTISSCGMVCYLQPNQVIMPLVAAVGEDVSTPYGEGKVVKYRLSDDVYKIKLTWSNATLYATAKKFDRIDDRMEDKGGFNMNWILQFFYSREENKEVGPPSQHSRSNSFSMLSQSGVSTKSLR